MKAMIYFFLPEWEKNKLYIESLNTSDFRLQIKLNELFGICK